MSKTTNLQIQKLEKQLAALKKKEANKKSSSQKRAIERILKIAKDAGLEPSDLVSALNALKGGKAKAVRKTAAPGKKSSRAGIKVPPKYRNPANPEQFWTGRGKTPAWVAALQAAGQIESALIK